MWVFTVSTIVAVFMLHVSVLLAAFGLFSEDGKPLVFAGFIGAILMVNLLRAINRDRKEFASKATPETRKDD